MKVFERINKKVEKYILKNQIQYYQNHSTSGMILYHNKREF